MIPVPLLFGRNGETFFFGILDPAGIEKKPEFVPDVEKLMADDSFGVGFFDTERLWEILRDAVADEKSFFRSAIPFPPGPEDLSIAADILDAELPVRLIKLWAPSIKTSFMEFSLTDVPAEKRLLPRVINRIAAIRAEEMERRMEIPEEDMGDFDMDDSDMEDSDAEDLDVD
jgi:hypothetical protein